MDRDAEVGLGMFVVVVIFLISFGMGECGFKVVVVSEGGIVTNDNDGILVDSGGNCCTPKDFLTQ